MPQISQQTTGEFPRSSTESNGASRSRARVGYGSDGMVAPQGCFVTHHALCGTSNYIRARSVLICLSHLPLKHGLLAGLPDPLIGPHSNAEFSQRPGQHASIGLSSRLHAKRSNLGG